ncbi:MAG: Tim44/TimA family putative adaptor protein [Azospirillaceae bacterium]|nr:Tim44/TimA family putative adaptor protein [Azospirillaceae bacterium]
MSDGFYFIDILIFAMIAAFLVYRLRSVLGRRTGDERRRANPFTPAPKDGAEAIAPARTVAPVRPVLVPDEPASLASALAYFQGLDPSFDEKAFIGGARAAFAMIVTAFAEGDTATLQPLLSREVYQRFAGSIRDRVAAGNSHETRIDRIINADLTEVRVDGQIAYCTVSFVSAQMNVTRDAQHAVVDGDPDHAIEVTDIWTFSRALGSANPNWVLVETRTPY